MDDDDEQPAAGRKKLLSCAAWAAVGMTVVIVVGALFHFVYEWSGDSKGVAWFAATNESVWEHMKLLVWPHVLVSVPMFLVGVDGRERIQDGRWVMTGQRDFWLSRAIGLLASLAVIPAIFYAYTGGGAEGKSILAVDLLTFVAAAVLGNFLMCGIRLESSLGATIFGLVLIYALLVVFIVFSYHPPTRRNLFFPYSEGSDIA